MDETLGAATRMAIDTGAGPHLIQRDALPPGAMERVQEVPKGGARKPRDVIGARYLPTDSVTLSVKVSARVALRELLVEDDISVPVILWCAFIDQNAHGILPLEQTVRWIDGSCT